MTVVRLPACPRIRVLVFVRNGKVQSFRPLTIAEEAMAGR